MSFEAQLHVRILWGPTNISSPLTRSQPLWISEFKVKPNVCVCTCMIIHTCSDNQAHQSVPFYPPPISCRDTQPAFITLTSHSFIIILLNLLTLTVSASFISPTVPESLSVTALWYQFLPVLPHALRLQNHVTTNSVFPENSEEHQSIPTAAGVLPLWPHSWPLHMVWSQIRSHCRVINPAEKNQCTATRFWKHSHILMPVVNMLHPQGVIPYSLSSCMNICPQAINTIKTHMM